MHKYYTGFRACFVICAAVLPNCLQAQWTACGTGPVQCAPTGNVGIGLANPNTKLQVAGDITGPANGWGNSQIMASGTSNSNQRLAIGFETVENVGFIQPYINGTGYNNLLLNPAGGNVGIGLSNPNTKLQVAGDITGPADGWGNSQIMASGTSNSNQRLAIGFETVENVGFIQPYINGTGYNNLLLNPAGGNVGIGTTNPAAKLDVAGNLKVEGAIVFSDGTTQTTAQKQGPPGPQGPTGPPGAQTSAVCSSASSCTAVCRVIVAQSYSNLNSFCQATSTTGQCSIPTGTPGSCCVCQ